MTGPLPLPVSALLRRATNAKAPKDRHDTAYFAWEASVVLAVAARPPPDLTALSRPSVGTWVAAMQAPQVRRGEAPLLAALALFAEVGTGRKAAPKRVSARELLDALPAYRNQVIGHGSTRAADFYDKASQVLVEGLEEAWQHEFFWREGERLTFAEAVEIDAAGRRRARLLDLTGDVGRVVDPRGTPDVPPDVLPHRTYVRSQDGFRPLHPWVLCREEDSRERVYLFGSLHHRAKYLDYVSGETLSGEALEAAFPGTEAHASTLLQGKTTDVAVSSADRLGDYRILGKLGSGGMGTVYRARRETPGSVLPAGTIVALKVAHPHLLETEGFVKRFQREAEIGKRIVHENVVRTFGVETVRQEARDHHFLVMEHVEGQTLRALLAELDRVPEELCRHIGREAAKGLAAIHACGVIHRDVKPENVFITNEHVVKVMDLGVARSVDERSRLSGTGAFVGSVPYAAPEQFRTGKEIDGRADLYSLGVTLYELATGRNPYADEDVHAMLRRVLYDAPRRCAEVNPQLSPFFEELVHTLLAKNPEGRIPSAVDLARILEEGEPSAWWTARAQDIRAATKRPLRRIRIPRETTLHGRDEEISKLRALYAKVKGGEGQVALVEGEAGIGKSRLVDEFVGLLQREGEDVNFLFGSYPPAGAATASGAFATAYREQFGVEGLEETLKTYLGETPSLVPAFGALLRGEGTPPGAEALSKDSLQTVFIHSTRVLAAERPTILLIDDLHFAPEEGRALFVALAMAIPAHRILLVGTARPGLDGRWLAHFDRLGALRLSLGRLGAKDLTRLLGEALRSEPLAEELAHRIGAKSDGNPFFVFEILRGMREGQFLSKTPEGAWVTTRAVADIQIPSSILELVQARVADLDESEHNLLDVAACIGFEFDPLLLAQVLGLAKIPAMQALARIEKKHRLVRSVGRRFVFDQHQVQEACYHGLPEVLREEYHAAVAEAIEVQNGLAGKDPKTWQGPVFVDLAEHLFKANRPERALPYLAPALAHLDKGYTNQAALDLEDRALDAPGLLEGADRALFLLRHARRLDLVGRPVEEETHLEEARVLADESGDVVLRAKVRNELGDLLRRTARYDDARRWLDEALALYREAHHREGEAVATVNLGVLAYLVGRYGEAREHQEHVLAIAREIGNRRLESTGTANLAGVFLTLGRHEEAKDFYERTLVIRRELKDRAGEARDGANLGLACEAQGRYAEALGHYERALATSREIGYRPAESHATICLGALLASIGSTVASRVHVERYLALTRETGDKRGEGTALLQLGSLLRNAGRPGEARAPMEQALATYRKIGNRSGVAEVLVRLGAALAEEGRHVEAAERLGEAASLARELSVPEILYLANARLATLPVPEAALATADALAAAAACEPTSGIDQAMEARFLLWRATHDVAHLGEAKRRLDHLLEFAPADARSSMVENVRLHRAIAEAARQAGV